MRYIKNFWLYIVTIGRRPFQYILATPFVWLFYCVFQPARFKRDFEAQSFWSRIVPMLRLALPVFLVSYTFTLIAQIILVKYFVTSGSSERELNFISFLSTTAWTTMLGVGWGIAAGILGEIRLGVILGTILSIGGVAGGSALGLIKGIMLAMALGVIGGTIGGGTWGLIAGVIGGLVGGFAWGGAWFISQDLIAGIRGGIEGVKGGIEVAIVFFVSYIFGYYRLLNYPISCLSGLWTYFACRKNPSLVFFHLHHSSLYWDERIYLPLPGLTHVLRIAAEQDADMALEEIAFIVAKRPQQVNAAQVVSLDIAIHKLEMCESIRDIARASQWLTENLSQEAALNNPRWVTPFARLNDASRDAARYCGPLGWKARYTALENMIINLERAYSTTAFTDTSLNKRLNEIVNTWRATARYEIEKLEQAPEKTGQIDNPYNPGQVLQARDSLFVGRRDLVQQLAEALGRGIRRPTFLLNGERRMGKSSTLKQLPNVLGADYLPIVFDLQVRGLSSSTDIFLSTIAGEVYKVAISRGIRIKKLEPGYLREASRKNEAEVYRLFDEWLDTLENILEQENRTLLLLFDEFEKLEEAGQDGYLNLNLVLDWFRSVIQNRHHVALLFSGVRTFGEMGANWASYFINAQTLKVSFLQVSEAYHLIAQPIPNFPSQQIYGDGVVDRIIYITGCHPFLIQAICSVLIEHLNAENRERAEIQDIDIVANQVLENWWETYFRDLWERSDQNQQICLISMRNIGEADPSQIVEESGLEEKTIRNTLQILLKRDLVQVKTGRYQITAPLFSEWVKRNS